MPQNVKPRFEVEVLDGSTTETHYSRIDGRNVESTVEVPRGYMVYFPAGHSIRVRTREELHRLGFDHGAELIDMDSGDVIGEAVPSLKQQVQRRAGASRRADITPVDANRGDT
jgi:hypothetical protein